MLRKRVIGHDHRRHRTEVLAGSDAHVFGAGAVLDQVSDGFTAGVMCAGAFRRRKTDDVGESAPELRAVSLVSAACAFRSRRLQKGSWWFLVVLCTPHR